MEQLKNTIILEFKIGFSLGIHADFPGHMNIVAMYLCDYIPSKL